MPPKSTESIKADLNSHLPPNTNASFEQLESGIHAFVTAQRKRLKEFVLDAQVGGFECCRFNTRFWDAVIQKIYEIAHNQIQTQPDIAIYAIGSYGREELCYHSDVDLVYTSSVDLEEVYDEKTLELIRLFYDFLDGLSDAIPSFKFSFIYRPLADIEQWNCQDMTGLIDMRFLAGDDCLTSLFKNSVRSAKSDISIVLELLKEKEDALKKSDDTIYLNQPDIKEGRGGLRTIQYALWMYGLREFVRIPELYERFHDEQLKPSLDFMFKVRNLLHVFADAPQETLSYHPGRNDFIQLKIAQALEYAGNTEDLVYRFMTDYYSHAKYLHFKAELLIGNLLESGIFISKAFVVRQSNIFCLNNDFESISADELFQLFAYFQRYDFEIDSELSTFIFTNVDCLDLIPLKQRLSELMAKPGSVSKALTRMHRLGIIERILPEFERAMMTRSERPTDPYTVGKHTLIAIEYLDEIRQSVPPQAFGIQTSDASEAEVLNSIYQQLSSVNDLYMALLLHDIDKPAPTHPHTGAEKANKIAREFGFDQAQTDEVCFLIREHLSMINLARYHQLSDETITRFQKRVKSLDRLMKLYLLTYCDSKANGPQNFTELDKDNLKRIYELVRSRFIGHDEKQWELYAPPDEFRRFLQQMPISYRMTYSPQEIAMHIKLVARIEQGADSKAQEEASRTRRDAVEPTPVALQFVDKPGFTELHLAGYSRVGNMHDVSGLFFAHHIDVREARIYTKTETKVALEIYHLVHQPPYLQHSTPMPLDEEIKKELTQEIQGLMNQQIPLEQLFQKHHTQLSHQWKVYDVEIDADSHKNYSEIVVRGEERPGFLYFFSGILAKLGLNIEMCKCAGFGGQAIDRFYLKPIAHPESIHQQILELLKVSE
jgi:[protein-PII] uridylyltransferase